MILFYLCTPLTLFLYIYFRFGKSAWSITFRWNRWFLHHGPPCHANALHLGKCFNQAFQVIVRHVENFNLSPQPDTMSVNEVPINVTWKNNWSGCVLMLPFALLSCSWQHRILILTTSPITAPECGQVYHTLVLRCWKYTVSFRCFSPSSLSR